MRTYPFLALVVTLTLVGAASAEQKSAAAVYRLQNIAATDAAKALTAFADENKLPLTVVAEPVSNSVLVAGPGASLTTVRGVLTKLDTAPPSVVVQLLFLHVPAGFSTDVGLAESDESWWVTTAREARMFTAAIRRAKEHGDIHILSRPQIQVADDQTATVAIEGFDLAARLTPRIAPDGGTALRLEADLAEAKAVRVTAKIPDGGTLVVRGPMTKNGELLLVATVNRVAK